MSDNTTTPPMPVRTTIPASRQFRITKPRCPICGATLRVRILELTREKNGQYSASTIDVQCERPTPRDVQEAERSNDMHLIAGDRMRPVRARLLEYVNSIHRFTPTT